MGLRPGLWFNEVRMKKDILHLESELNRSMHEDRLNNRRAREDDSFYPQSERTKELQRQLDDARRANG